MRPAFQSVLAAAFLAMASVAVADPFKDGQAAYDRHDYATALQDWQPLADQGLAAAQGGLGLMYANGEGVPKDYAEAVKWFRSTADHGDARAQFDLGVSYANGQGVPKDYAEAVKWFRSAADQGDANGQFSLGVMFSNGQGVPKDDVRAYMWLNLAAAKGVMNASEYRDDCLRHMNSIQVAEGQRLARMGSDRCFAALASASSWHARVDNRCD